LLRRWYRRLHAIQVGGGAGWTRGGLRFGPRTNKTTKAARSSRPTSIGRLLQVARAALQPFNLCSMLYMINAFDSRSPRPTARIEPLSNFTWATEELRNQPNQLAIVHNSSHPARLVGTSHPVVRVLNARRIQPFAWSVRYPEVHISLRNFADNVCAPLPFPLVFAC
jgi:hypothetical protein